MSASPFVRTETPRTERGSDSPLSIDLAGDTGRLSIPASWASRIPRSWMGLSGYLVAGVFLGLILIIAMSLTRGESSATAAASAGVITDNVVHLHSREINGNCWRGTAKDDGPARVTVSLEIGLDGKVRKAIAAGESPAMRGCVESHVKSWEFLPQASSSQMVLPFEIDAR